MRCQLYALFSVVVLTCSSVLSATDVPGGGGGGGFGGTLEMTAPSDIGDMLVGLPITEIACQATGGTAPYTWSATGLPPGLAIADQVGSDDGEISGTPEAAAGGRTFEIRLTVTDADSDTDSNTYTVFVSEAGSVEIVAPTGIDDMQEGVGAPTIQCTAEGGTTPYTWSVDGLPDGLTLLTSGDVARIQGTPAAGSGGQEYEIELTVEDDASSSDTETFTVFVAADVGLTITEPLTIDDMPEGVVLTNIPLRASGGEAPYEWSADGLPEGLSVDKLTGFGWFIRGAPEVGTAGQTYTATLTVEEDSGSSTSKAFEFDVTPPIQLTQPTQIPDMMQEVEIANVQCEVINGVQPYSWQVNGMPDGIEFDILDTEGTKAIFEGTPDQSTGGQSYTIEIEVSDAADQVTSQSFEFFVHSPVTFVSPEIIDPGMQGIGYSYTLEAESGYVSDGGSYTFSSSNLPDWLFLDQNTGELYGMPDQVASYGFDVQVEDEWGSPTSQVMTFFLSVGVDTTHVRILTESFPQVQVDEDVDIQLVATWGNGEYAWSVEGLPDGLSASLDGQITGVPLADSVGGHIVEVVVEDTQDAPTRDAVYLNLLVVTAEDGVSLSITTGFLLPGVEDEAYHGMFLEADGGEAPYSWSVIGLPPGLVLLDDEIRGTPAFGSVGVYSVEVEALDQSEERVAQIFTLIIAPDLSVEDDDETGRPPNFSELALGAAAAGCSLDSDNKNQAAAFVLLMFAVAAVVSLGALRRRQESKKS